MSQFFSFNIENHTLVLQQWLKQQKNVFEFSVADYSSLLICQILIKEIGGPNDSLSRYIYDTEKKKKIDKQLLIANISMEFDISPVVQIILPQPKKLGVTLSYLREVINFYDNKVIISPTRIAAYLRSHNLIPVFVVPWIQQSLFSVFDMRTESVSDQLWVLQNNDIYPSHFKMRTRVNAGFESYQ